MPRSKPSKPSWLSTAPARAAKRRASSSPLSAGTVIALIFTTVISSIMPGDASARARVPTYSNPLARARRGPAGQLLSSGRPSGIAGPPVATWAMWKNRYTPTAAKTRIT